MGRLLGKVAIITGAAGGMGLADAQLFAKEGAKVVATDVQFELLQQGVDAINANGGDAVAVKLDVSSPEGWKQVVDLTVEKYGKIDILVNNAGIHIAKTILEADIDDWNKVMAINTTGVFLGMKSVIPEMQKNGKGSIVNISSIAAIVGGENADGNGAAYSASKGAVRSLTKHAAQSFAKDNIRVNSIHPGPIKTPIMGEFAKIAGDIYKNAVPLPPHAGDPEDIAYGVLYLASDESKFVTGEELVIDGGAITK
ncbi:SDR family NAD(P)-dependent oxidoreductase [Paenibacillus sp. YIM B09110]|uniref:SDR family NAD(P)-dependent oxidoreductase n=1 Tax=Paenibacillus sp. YIM B09110 TaxID=3126102 RepID=UPI00301C25BC